MKIGHCTLYPYRQWMGSEYIPIIWNNDCTEKQRLKCYCFEATKYGPKISGTPLVSRVMGSASVLTSPQAQVAFPHLVCLL